jgi:hypothetical protein
VLDVRRHPGRQDSQFSPDKGSDKGSIHTEPILPSNYAIKANVLVAGRIDQARVVSTGHSLAV